MVEFDKGPTKRIASIFAALPDHAPIKDHFWFDWGPVFYRGRLNGRARLACVASDPGPTERIACRSLVGDAGQRVQGFLAKVGLTRSYVCLNAFAFALHPGSFFDGLDLLADAGQTRWRNRLFDAVTGPDLQAVVAFGLLAQVAVDLWPGRGDVAVFKVPHPSSDDEPRLVSTWRDAITALREVVTPDPDGDPASPNYGAAFEEGDYAPIPRRDLPFGVPWWLGDDAWGRRARPKHHNSVRRPRPDDGHTLMWIAPDSDADSSRDASALANPDAMLGTDAEP